MSCQEAEKISIVIPAYNCEGTIERCVQSALAQTYDNTEIIIVDDGSTDRTAGLLDTFAREHETVSVIHKENGGVASARNEGMKAASGVWLVTLDADDYIDAEMLKTMHAAAKRADAQLCICGFRMIYENQGIREIRQADEDFEGNKNELLNTVFLTLYDRQLINNQNNKLYRLDIIQENGLYYDERMQINEDLWFSLKYMQHSSEFAVLRKPFLNYTQHGEGESLVSKFHENCVETCFAVLKAYDELFDGSNVSDHIINSMNNRMLFHICGYAGWQYYKSGYSDERMLANIRALCARPELQKLLSQTDPYGMKNRVAYSLLKRGKAEAYHKLCKLLYKGKRAQRAELCGMPEPAEEKAAAAAREEMTAPAAPIETAETAESAKIAAEKAVSEMAAEASEQEVAEHTETADADEALTEAEEISGAEAPEGKSEDGTEEKAAESANGGAEETASDEGAASEEAETKEAEELKETEPAEEAPKHEDAAEPVEAESEAVTEPAAEASGEPVSAEEENEISEETSAKECEEAAVNGTEEEPEEENVQEELPESVVPRQPVVVKKIEIREIVPESEAAADDYFAEELYEDGDADDMMPDLFGDPFEETGSLEPEKPGGRSRHRRRRKARRPREHYNIEGQIELWDLLRANGSLDGITDEELENITKKLENSI